MSSVRDAFFTEIYNQVKEGENIYIVSADLGAPSLDDFRRDYPERYISVGIAEQNLIQVAAGLASSGLKVIAYGLNPFPITRAFDQIRCLMAELKIPVTLCVLNAGLCSAECGYTHMPIEDIAMIRTLSNIEVFNPSDVMISRMLARETVNIRKPRIIRFDKTISGSIYDDGITDLMKGFGVLGCRDLTEVGVITNGCYSKELSQSEFVKENKIKLFDLFRIPTDEEKLIEEIRKCKRLLTLEENVMQGGIGSMIVELLADCQLCIPVKRLALDLRKGYYDVFTNRELIRMKQGISKTDVINIVEKELSEGEKSNEVFCSES